MHKCTEYGSKSKFKLLVVLRRSFVEEVDHVVAREMADLNPSISPIRLQFTTITFRRIKCCLKYL